MIRIASFDVFDTCLTRKCGNATTLFALLGQSILKHLGRVFDRPAVEDFVTARIQAEQWCRSHTASEEVTLQDIWVRLCETQQWKFEQDFVSIELTEESKQLQVTSDALTRINEARNKGQRIIFISDTYLPSNFIEEQLTRYDLLRLNDNVYCSSSVGKTKATGNLFTHVLVQEDVLGREVLHCGDNIQSDIQQATKKGIKTRRFQTSDPTQTEKAIHETGLVSSLPARQLAGAMRSFRLTSEHVDTTDLVSQFLGPFCVTFASWVLGKAKESGIECLYFLTRDCQLILEAAKVLTPKFGGIECRSLQVSRQALFLPAADGISDEHMPSMRRFFETPSLRRLLAKLELDENALSEFFSIPGGLKIDDELRNESDWKQFWQSLNKEPLRGNLLSLIKKRRTAALAYFEKKGLFQQKKWAIVDLGWFLTGQEALQRILRSTGWQGELSGFYLGLNKNRRQRAITGRAEALYYQVPAEVYGPQPQDFVFNCATILEHVVGISDSSTLHHYELDEENFSHAIAQTPEPNLETVRLYIKLTHEIRLFAELCVNIGIDLADSEVAGSAIRVLVHNFVSTPSVGVARPLLGLPTGSDQNNLDETPLIKPLGWMDLVAPLFPKRKLFSLLWKRSVRLWFEGSYASSSPTLQRLYSFSRQLEKARLVIARKAKRFFGNNPS